MGLNLGKDIIFLFFFGILETINGGGQLMMPVVMVLARGWPVRAG